MSFFVQNREAYLSPPFGWQLAVNSFIMQLYPFFQNSFLKQESFLKGIMDFVCLQIQYIGSNHVQSGMTKREYFTKK